MSDCGTSHWSGASFLRSGRIHLTENDATLEFYTFCLLCFVRYPDAYTRILLLSLTSLFELISSFRLLKVDCVLKTRDVWFARLANV
jgi:hypothetical protein